MAVFASNRQNQPNAHVNSARMLPKPKKSSTLNKGKGKENLPNPSPLPPLDRVSWNEEGHDDEPWDWCYLNDFSSSKVAPLFSKDGSYFFSLAGASIQIFSVTTGKVVSELITPSATASGPRPTHFTSALINPHNAFQLIASTIDGRLLIWDFLNATLLREIDIGQPIHFICAHETFKDSIVAAASLPNKRSNDQDGVVLRVSLKTNSSGKPLAEVRAIGKTRLLSGLAFSPNGDWLVAAGGHTIYVARSSDLGSGFIKYISPERLTCLTMHPSDEYFATGDETGNIRLWYCLNNSAVTSRGVEKRTQTTSLHWHSHAVSSLAFTPNGAYLLSGGVEAVLVIWQLHTGKKEFVPRVGSAISTISVCQGPVSEEYLLGLADGAFCFVSSGALKVTRSFSQIKIDTEGRGDVASSSRFPLSFHRPSASLILPSSHPSSLQIYSPYSHTLVSELEVCPSNRVSKRDDKPIECSRVQRVEISSSGLWMATLDSREGEVHPEIFLKIWSWDPKTSSWKLRIRIDQPHGVKHVVHLGFSPQADSVLYLSSCGEDGSIKIWRLKSRQTEDVWLPHASLNFYASALKSLSWSPDGSIFVASLGTQVVIYDSSSVTKRGALCSPGQKDIMSSHFIGNFYLLVVSQRRLVLWDLVGHTVCWDHTSNAVIDLVIPHPQQNSFAVFYKADQSTDQCKTLVRVFDATAAQPRAEHSVPLRLRNVVWFDSPESADRFGLVAVTNDSKIVLIGNDPLKTRMNHAPAIAFQSRNVTLFQDLFGQSLLDSFSSPNQPSTSVIHDNTSRHIIDQDILNQPSHLTPPLATLFDPLLATFLHPTAVLSTTSVPEEQDSDTDDEVMEDDTFPTTMATASMLSSRICLDELGHFFRQSSRVRQPVTSQSNGKAKISLTNGSHPIDSQTDVISSPKKMLSSASRTRKKSGI